MAAEIVISPKLSIPMREVEFRMSRSGGPGGQHVNKTETRVELIFDVERAPSLSDTQRARLLKALGKKLDKAFRLHIVCSEERSQLQNKHRAIEIFATTIVAGLRRRKQRIPTSPTRSAQERRIYEKRFLGERKRGRKASDDE